LLAWLPITVYNIKHAQKPWTGCNEAGYRLVRCNDWQISKHAAEEVGLTAARFLRGHTGDIRAAKWNKVSVLIDNVGE
jgi:hypothetical protein